MNSKYKTQLLLLFFFLVKFYGFSQQKYSEISRQLDSIYYDDQKYRLELDRINKASSTNFDKLRELIIENDSVNVRKVERIINRYGWLGIEDVGEKSNQALFLVIQHANLSIQEKYLPLIQNAVKNKKASPDQLALLEDRIAIANGKEQIYGSQLNYDNKNNQYTLAPIFDEVNLNKRRALVGLPTIEVYLKNFGIDYKYSPIKESKFNDFKRFNLILLCFVLLFLIIVLFKKKKKSPWYWFGIIVLLLTLIDLYFDYYRIYSLIKQYHESWILFSILKPLLIFTITILIKYIWSIIFSIENIIVDITTIFLSYICYSTIFSKSLQALILTDNSIVFFFNIIEPCIYVVIYIIIWVIINQIEKRRKKFFINS